MSEITVGPIATIVAAILTVSVTVFVTLWLQKRKRLSFWIEETEDLTRAVREHMRFITFKVNEQEVQNLNRATVRVRNSGNVSISNCEFKIILLGDRKLNFAAVLSDNEQLRQDVKVSSQPTGMQYDPVYIVNVPFLNPHEAFSVQIFLMERLRTAPFIVVLKM